MKVNRSNLISIVSLIVTLFLNTGCTYVLNITETPALQMGSPLRSVEPKTFAFRDFQDIRGVEDPSLMIKIGFSTHSLDQPPAIFIADRIKKEFERNGHKCVDASSKAKADFIVDGKIYKMSFQNIHGTWIMTQIAKAGVKLTINRVPSESGVFEKSYEGEYTSKSAILTGIAEKLGQAALSMIKDISTDPELIEFLKK